MSIGTILYAILIMPLQLFFEVVFSFAQRFTDNPGLSIIILSLTVNFLVLPLYKRADDLQTEQREIEARMAHWVSHIKKTFSGDERMMILQTYYRQNKYKPTDVIKESISLLIQIPFFIAAYQFLSNISILEGVSFGPINDLGAPDALITIGTISINLLPFLMTGINIISCLIYTKGFPLKSKIQLYLMAFIFLVFLYGSPSGLVFYWTLNNLFSLFKTVFYKLKNPGKALKILCSITGIIAIIYGVIFFDNTLKRRMILVLIGMTMQFPVIFGMAENKKYISKDFYKISSKTNRVLFRIAGIMLTVLVGGLIPSALIKSSPLEFVNMAAFLNPIWYVIYGLCLSLGTFVIWFGVFYEISNNFGKIILEKLLCVLCGIAVVDYLFFGTDLGTISPDLRFVNEFNYSIKLSVLNIGILSIVTFIIVFIQSKSSRILESIMITVLLAMVVMCSINSLSIKQKVDPLASSSVLSQPDITFTLSRKGNNVIIIMLDRAIGPYIPYIMHEKPDLEEKFDGFTYYSNTISFGYSTNFGTPALFGGYEYSPVELNKRSDESLVSKQNEALRVLPVLFDDNEYEVTVCDPPYAGYSWIPDLTIYADHPNIKRYNTDGMFSRDIQISKQKNRSRNFYMYGLMKISPLFSQKYIYNGSNYNHIQMKNESTTTQVTDGYSKAYGISSVFLDTFNVLNNLYVLTRITDNKIDTFLMMSNNTTHEPTLLQEPDYLPEEVVDNTEFDKENIERFTVNNIKMEMNDESHYAHYQVNMAGLIQLGNWFDYLREKDVYDNSRIIIVSDHGRGLNQFNDLILDFEDGISYDLESYSSLLMFKDFEERGYRTSDEFMTLGDVPSLAVGDLINNPINPFTGQNIDNKAKYMHDQLVISGSSWKTDVNNGNQFLPGDWLAVHDDIWNKDNWRVVARNAVLTGYEEDQ